MRCANWAEVGRCSDSRSDSLLPRASTRFLGLGVDSSLAEGVINGGVMFVIGQFAQFAKVSVRTLRHYDDVGLLGPARVDDRTGYRYYRADQLLVLNRILVLKDLGFTLAEITDMTESGITAAELSGMVRLRQTEAEREAETERRRLQRTAARIDLLKGDPTMQTTAIVIKALDAMHLATATEPVEGFDADFAPIFERLYSTVFEPLAQNRIDPTGPHCATYEQREDGRIDVVAGVPVPRDVQDVDGVRIRELPAVERAATMLHTGDMSECDRSYQLLQQWIDDADENPVGFSREIYLDCTGERDQWVTELQFVLGS